MLTSYPDDYEGNDRNLVDRPSDSYADFHASSRRDSDAIIAFCGLANVLIL